jgi:hypothetical protein
MMMNGGYIITQDRHHFSKSELAAPLQVSFVSSLSLAFHAIGFFILF